MIAHDEIKGLVAELSLREDVIEKDYIIGWVLWGIGSDDELGRTWVFKGGTCLKKCYLETYRFSEDLDFTVLPGGPITPDAVQPLIERVLTRINEASGIDFSIQAPRLRSRPNPATSEGRVYYRGPRNSPSIASLKLDLSADEKVIRPPVLRPIGHPYSDGLPPPAHVRCYSFEELFAEKIRALAERTRPRDLYDVINLYRRPDLQAAPTLIRSVLSEKCAVKGIPVPTHRSIQESPYRGELESEWSNMLGHQLPALPPLQQFAEELGGLFDWLEGKVAPAQLEPVPLEKNETASWTPPPAAWTLGAGVPLETIRFAAANHLCIEIVYRNEQGQVASRVLEPYALRQTREGNLLLHAVRSDSRASRTYRIDRIQQVRVTTRPFRPIYQIEFTAMGPINAPLAPGRSFRPSSPARIKSMSSPGIVYVYQCSSCFKQFKRSTQSSTLRAHKNSFGTPCSGRSGFLVNTLYR